MMGSARHQSCASMTLLGQNLLMNRMPDACKKKREADVAQIGECSQSHAYRKTINVNESRHFPKN